MSCTRPISETERSHLEDVARAAGIAVRIVDSDLEELEEISCGHPITMSVREEINRAQAVFEVAFAVDCAVDAAIWTFDNADGRYIHDAINSSIWSSVDAIEHDSCSLAELKATADIIRRHFPIAPVPVED